MSANYCGACDRAWPVTYVRCPICDQSLLHRHVGVVDDDWQQAIENAAELVDDTDAMPTGVREWRLSAFTRLGVGELAEVLALSRVAVTEFEKLLGRGCPV